MKFSNVKRVLAAACAVALTATLVACGGSQSSSDNNTSSASDSAAPTAEAGDSGIKVGFALPDRDQYWASFEKGAKEYMDENGIGYDINIAKEDVSTQIAQIEAYANQGYNACIVGLADPNTWQEALNAAGDMKVVFFNRQPADSAAYDGKQAVYVGMSEYDAGKAQGEWLVKHFDEAGADKNLNGVMLMGVLGQTNVTDRTNGAKDALEAGGYTVNWILDDTAEWDKVKAVDKITPVLGKGDKIDLIVCNNDEMALGCIEAFKGNNKEIDCPIVGIDATETGCQAVLDGTLAMTVNQNPFAQGVAAINCVIGLIDGNLPAEVNENNEYATPAEAVTTAEAQGVLDTFK